MSFLGARLRKTFTTDLELQGQKPYHFVQYVIFRRKGIVVSTWRIIRKTKCSSTAGRAFAKVSFNSLSNKNFVNWILRRRYRYEILEDWWIWTNGKHKNKMAFILGDTFKISDTRRPIWVKLWGCIEFALKLCNVILSTFGLDLKTGNWNFLENPTTIPCKNFLEIPDFFDTETFPNLF